MGDDLKVRLLEATLEGKRTRRRLTVAAALVFAIIAAAASYYWYQAHRALDAATAMISSLVEAASDTAQTNPHAENIEALRELTRKAIDGFAASSSDPRIVQQRARSYLTLAEIDFERGWIDRMQEDAQLALASIDGLATSGNLEARHLRAQAERLIGATQWERGNNEEAKLHFERGIADLNELLKLNVDSNIAWRWMRSLADLHQALGDVLLYRFDQRDEALAAYNKSRELRERLAALGHQGPALEIDLAWIAGRRAEVAERKGNIDEALTLSAEALDRMEGLKDRIWDNLRWAADYGSISANIGRLKRKQKRYAEAAPIFARAEEILLAVNKRDPKNKTRMATLNWIRFLRAENLFRLGMQNNDRIRLLSAREQAQAIIATTAALAGDSAERSQIRLSKVREEAFLAAIDATLRQLNGNHESAAAGYLEASEIIANGRSADTKTMPSGDLMTENIEYLEWAGMAYVKAQKPVEAQALFKRATEMLGKYRQALGEKVYEDLHQRIDARIDRAPPAISRTPASANRTPADRGPITTESIPPAAANPADDAKPQASESTPPAAQVPAVESSTPPADPSPPAAAAAPAASDPVSPPQQ